MSVIKMFHHSSSNLKAFGYDSVTQTLRVKFLGKNDKPDTVGEYFPVSAMRNQELNQADSYGSFLDKYIKKDPDIQYRKLEFGEGEWDGEERRIMGLPWRVESQTSPKRECFIIKGGADDAIIQIESMDDTLEDEKILLERICACMNAAVGIPSERIADVISAGMTALGIYDRRNRETKDVSDNSFIVKVQRPLAGENLVLIYNKDRSLTDHSIPFDGLIAELFTQQGNPFKLYFYARLNAEGKLLLGEIAEAQEW